MKTLVVMALGTTLGLASCGGGTIPEGPDGGDGLCATDEECQDGLLCNGPELCVAGTCSTGALLDCDDGDPCTDDECREGEGGCVHDWVEPDEDGDGHVLAACGGEDCDDTRSDAFPGADELCNGLDDDCDGVVDERLDPVRLAASAAGEGSFGHSIAWSQSGRFLVAWHRRGADPAPVRMVALDVRGEVLGSGEVGAPSEELITPVLARHGEGFALVWNHRSGSVDGGHSISFAPVDDHGDVEAAVEVTTDTEVELLGPSLLAQTTGSLLVYRYGDFGSGFSELHSIPLDARGHPLADPTVLTAPGVSGFAHLLVGGEGGPPSLAYLARESASFWVAYQQLTEEGQPRGDAWTLTFSAGFPYSMAAEAIGGEVVVAWSELLFSGTGDMHAIRLDDGGEPVEPSEPLTRHHGGSVRPALAWTGSHLGLAWTSYPEGDVDPDARAEVRFTTLTAELLEEAEPVTVSTGQDRAVHPELVWAADRFGLIWTGEDDGAEALFFTTLCPAPPE